MLSTPAANGENRQRETDSCSRIFNTWLAFVYTTPEIIHTFAKDTKDLHFLNHYYNHFETDSYGKNPPLVVDDAAMMNFIKVTSVDNEHVMVVPERLCHYKSGDMVRVIDGDFKGVIGKVARVSGQQRVVVEIKGVCLVSTAYIPSAFIEKYRSCARHGFRANVYEKALFIIVLVDDGWLPAVCASC